MGLIGLLVLALAIWLFWTGRLQRLTFGDGAMLGVGLIGLVMAVKGKPLLAALPILVAGGYGLWRNLRRVKPSLPAGPPPAPPASLAEARALLGVGPQADAEEIRAAHKRLIALTHPDRGGTPALAAKINAARDLLLAHVPPTDPPPSS